MFLHMHMAVPQGPWGHIYFKPCPKSTHRLDWTGLLQLKGSVKTCILGVCISGDVKTVSAKGKAASAGE